jgi:hypothetical protein
MDFLWQLRVQYLELGSQKEIESAQYLVSQFQEHQMDFLLQLGVL